jgi:hypothetical protein
MDKHQMLLRLIPQLPGWKVWRSSPGGWNAVPAPADVSLDEALYMPGRMTAATPAELKKLCLARYGWDDYCETCGVLARECGHRAPESK